MWRIEHFSRLKDVLKKRKITGLCVKSQALPGGRLHLPPHHLPPRWANIPSDKQPLVGHVLLERLLTNCLHKHMLPSCPVMS